MEITKDLLCNLYYVDNKTLKEIQNYLNIPYCRVKKYMKLYNIVIKPTGNYKNKEYHFKSYNKKELTDINGFINAYNNYTPIKDIIQMFNISEHSVYKYIKELNLHRDNNKMMSRSQYDNSNDEQIIKLYKNGKSTTEIANIFNTTHATIRKHLKKCGINRRTLSESQFIYNKKKFPSELDNKYILKELYINKKLSLKEIGKIYNCSPAVISRLLKKHNIKKRTESEVKFILNGKQYPELLDNKEFLYDLYINQNKTKKQICKMFNIDISALNRRLEIFNIKSKLIKNRQTKEERLLRQKVRNYFIQRQTKLILERDNYKCVLCGNSTNLSIHHIIPFNEIFMNILNNNSQLTPHNNFDELFNICINDPILNDLNNLKTYCKHCHLYKIHNFTENKLS